MHTTTRLLSIAGAATMAVTLTACGSVDPYGSNNYPSSPVSSYPTTSYPAPAGSYNQPVAGTEYGRVTDVRLVSGPAAPRGNRIAGTAIGAIIGGVLGNQIGGGSGRAAATVLGAVGGGVVGNKIAENQQNAYAGNPNQTVYRISVQTDTGQMRTYDVSATGDLQPGDRVRIDNGVIYHA